MPGRFKHVSRFENIEYQPSKWLPPKQAIAEVQPGTFGVYLARFAFAGGASVGTPKDPTSDAYEDEDVFYVGRSDGRVQQRLREYLQGDDLNGLAEVMLYLALNNPLWICEQLRDVLSGIETNGTKWMRHAIGRIPIEISVLVTKSALDAKRLEDELIAHHGPYLLNRSVRNTREEGTRRNYLRRINDVHAGEPEG